MKSSLHARPQRLHEPRRSFWALVAAALVAAFVVGIVYQSVQAWSSSVMLVMFVPPLVGALAGVLTTTVIGAGRCLDLRWGALSGVLIGFTVLYASWLTATLDFYGESWTQHESLGQLAFRPDLHFRAAHEAADIGVYEISGEAVHPAAQWIAWFLEAMVLIAYPGVMGYLAALRGAVCPNCESWMERTERDFDAPQRGVKPSAMYRDMSELAKLVDPTQYKGDFLVAECWECDACRGPAIVRLNVAKELKRKRLVYENNLTPFTPRLVVPSKGQARR